MRSASSTSNTIARPIVTSVIAFLSTFAHSSGYRTPIPDAGPHPFSHQPDLSPLQLSPGPATYPHCTCPRRTLYPAVPYAAIRRHFSLAAQHRTAKQGAESFMTRWIAAERAWAALKHAETCPNVTGRTKERVPQSKRTRTGLLATID